MHIKSHQTWFHNIGATLAPSSAQSPRSVHNQCHQKSIIFINTPSILLAHNQFHQYSINFINTQSNSSIHNQLPSISLMYYLLNWFQINSHLQLSMYNTRPLIQIKSILPTSMHDSIPSVQINSHFQLSMNKPCHQFTSLTIMILGVCEISYI